MGTLLNSLAVVRLYGIHIILYHIYTHLQNRRAFPKRLLTIIFLNFLLALMSSFKSCEYISTNERSILAIPGKALASKFELKLNPLTVVDIPIQIFMSHKNFIPLDSNSLKSNVLFPLGENIGYILTLVPLSKPWLSTSLDSGLWSLLFKLSLNLFMNAFVQVRNFVFSEYSLC